MDLEKARAALRTLEKFAQGIKDAGSLLATLEDYEREAGRRKDEIGRLDAGITRLEEKKLALAGEFAAKKAEMDAGLAALLQDAKERRAVILAETKSAITVGQESIAELNRELGVKRAELDAATSELSDTKRTLSALKDELSALRARIG